MAPTRQLEQEAQISSSDDEDEASSEENEEQQESESEEEDKTSPPTPPKDKRPASAKKPETTRTPATQPQSSSDDDSESGSDSDDDSGDLVVRARKADPNVKPIASKPMEEPPKATKKPRSKPSASASVLETPVKSTTGSKRANESEKSRDGKDSKKAKKRATDPENGAAEDDTAKKTADDSKKQLFQRLWTEEDEIAVLKGMVEYMEKKGADPVAEMNAFHEFMKDKLHIDFSKTQLSDKVRRLKKKFENNASKGKNGEDRTFPKAHDQKAYELSKKVWGVEANHMGFDSPKVNGKSKKSQNKKTGKALDLIPKGDVISSPEKDKEVAKMEVEHNHSVTVPPSARLFRGIGDSSFGEEMVRHGIELIQGDKRVEMEEKWKQLRVEEIELYLKRTELIREQTKLVLEALKPSGH